ncbi:two pore domain potassium channel family protein [Pseudoalteromonas sp. SG43-1]|uniref:potassium channel family protein n=1 Tax=Pseudoalteromonas sp. SG43-1 TaxID=2760971 RepID=UPI0015FFCAB0|nr:potassium channel family protein [Pseudoalteromonas sp. SG43-1]MBB1453432.1 two pore domain potassium channel family protein [Pseudoalteromonas sp. SG43-1]
MIEAKSKKIKLAKKLSLIFTAFVLSFGVIYWLLGCIDGHGVYSGKTKAGFFDSIYFSVVSITTLGYGDFTPSGVARVFASLESIFGLIFVGFGISQVLSVKQDLVVEYIVNDRILQTYNECIVNLADAKELIGDRRRLIKHKSKVDELDFIYNRSNPFYPALKSIQTLNGYTAHIEEIEKTELLGKHIERASHHVEELVGFSRRYISALENNGTHWQTPRTKKILIHLCDATDTFVDKYIPYTKYGTSSYKNGGLYKDIVQSIVNNIRNSCVK